MAPLFPRPHLLRQALLSAVLVLGFATPALANPCCKCVATDAPSNSVCLRAEDGTTCADLTSKSSNENVKLLTCSTELSDVQCNKIGSNPSAICRGEPQDSANYQPTKGKDISTAAKDGVPVIAPSLGVPIPGLQFASVLTPVNNKITIPFIAQYVAAAYRYLIIVSLVAASVMIVYGGFLYITSATAGNVKKGKDIIVDALIGVIILLSASVILNTVNSDTTMLKGIEIAQVPAMDYFIEANQIGYKDARGSSISDEAATLARTGGDSPYVARYDGENVSIRDIIAQEGKYKLKSQRLQAYCTVPSDADKMKGYDEKIQALVRVTLGFYHVCVQQKGCEYVRGGYTDLVSGKVTAGAADVPFLFDKLALLKATVENWPADCEQRYNEGGTAILAPAKLKNSVPKEAYELGDDCGDPNKPCTIKYKPLAKTFYKFRAFPQIIADFDFMGNGKCYKPVHDAYQKELADKMTEEGHFGGDCGSTLVQMYKCAGGKVARPESGKPWSIFNYINYGLLMSYSNPDTRPGKDFIVWRAKDLDDLREQITQNGPLKFGDIIVAGAENHQHNFMFTGGRADVPFEIIEMGGKGEGGGTETPNFKRAWSREFPQIGGMAYHTPRSVAGMETLAYLDSSGKSYCKNKQQCGDQYGQLVGKSNWYPITIARPYEYDYCNNRNDCKDDEVCLCTSADKISAVQVTECEDSEVNGKKKCKKTQVQRCAMQNICRVPIKKKGQEMLYCTNDEMCPNGSKCILKGRDDGFCNGQTNCKLNYCFAA